MEDGHYVFISYAHADDDYVGRLVEHLRSEGADVWRDDQIATSQRWDAVLEERIDACDAVVVVMSPAARGSYWVGVELDHARRRGRPIYPLLLDGEPLFGLGVLQYESVVRGRMPSSAFTARLSTATVAAPAFARASTVRQVGVVPNPASSFQQRPIGEDLDRALTGQGTAIVTQVLSGLGGVGKTQLAAATVRQLVARGAVDDVVWVTATSGDAVVSTLAEGASVVTQTTAGDPSAAARLLLSWLAITDRQWLIVFDDLADPNDLDGWWRPPSPNGRVLVTTRRRDAALLGKGRLVQVEQFTPAEAHSYLVDVFAGHARRLFEADDLTRDLGYLPVALAQAAAYIVDRNLTCAQYRQRFATHPLAALAPSAWPDEYARPVAVTLDLAVSAADALPPVGLARPLLLLLSLLDPNGIPAQITATDAVLAYLSSQAGAAVEADQASDALTCLARLNLADIVQSPTADDDRVRVHALVQRAARDQATTDAREMAGRAAADALLALWPNVQRDLDLVQLLRTSTIALRTHADDLLLTPGSHALLFRMGNSLGIAGLVQAACTYFATLTTATQTRLGPDHADTLRTRGNLARWRGEAGDPAGAVSAFEQILADRQRVLGADHRHTVTSQHHLAYWRGKAGDLVGAVSAYEQILADHLRVLGPAHPHTLATRSNMAYLRGQASDLAGAVSAFEQLLTDYLRVLGPDHPETLITRSNLVYWRGRAGDPGGAAAAFEQLLADYLRVFGPDNPGTLTTRSNLARSRGQAGDPASAVAGFEQLLTDYRRVLGPDHPRTLATRGSLARWRGEAGDPAGAVSAFEQILADRQRVLGPDHRHSLTSQHHLAYWRGKAGDLVGAVTAYEQILADHLRVLGPDHHNTLTSRHNLAYWRGRAGDPASAAAAFEQLLADYLRVVGPDHPSTLATRGNLARWRGEAGDTAGAVAAIDQLLTDYLRVLGPDSTEIVTARRALAYWRDKAAN